MEIKKHLYSLALALFCVIYSSWWSQRFILQKWVLQRNSSNEKEKAMLVLISRKVYFIKHGISFIRALVPFEKAAYSSVCGHMWLLSRITLAWAVSAVWQRPAFVKNGDKYIYCLLHRSNRFLLHPLCTHPSRSWWLFIEKKHIKQARGCINSQI